MTPTTETTVLEPTISEVTWARRAARHIARRIGEEAAASFKPDGSRVGDIVVTPSGPWLTIATFDAESFTFRN